MVGALALIAVLGACTRPSTNPAQPVSGLGADGPCTLTSTRVANPDAPLQPITVYEPAGNGATPLTGGACDALSQDLL
jgi:hypothetical protein